MAPPGIVAVALGEDAEGVDEAGIDEILEALALLVGEAFLAALGFGFARSSSVCATLRSPQKITGFFLSSCLQ